VLKKEHFIRLQGTQAFSGWDMDLDMSTKYITTMLLMATRNPANSPVEGKEV